MRRIGAILFALVLCLVWGSSVLAAPQEATGAATIGLERFKELMAPNADRMGLTKEALQAANLGPGYQVVSWTPGASGKGRKPDMAMAPMGNDTWVYQVLSGTDPVMLWGLRLSELFSLTLSEPA